MAPKDPAKKEVSEKANETLIRGIAMPYIRSCLGDDLVDRAIAAGIVRVI